MPYKIAIIGAGAAGIAAIDYLFENIDDCTIDVFEGRSGWGGRVKNLTVGDEQIDFGAEAIENADSEWLELLEQGAVDYEWVNLMAEAQYGLYWANSKVQTVDDAVEQEAEFGKLSDRITEIGNSRIEDAKLGMSIVPARFFESYADHLKGHMTYTCVESIEPWISSALDKSRFASESTETYPTIKISKARSTLGQAFASLGAHLLSEYEDELTVHFEKKVKAVQISQNILKPGYSIVDAGNSCYNGYQSVLITTPVPLVDEIELPMSANQAFDEVSDGIELGHYIKFAWPWKEAVDYYTNKAGKGARVWLADPEGQFVWSLYTFPGSNVLIASTTGSYARQCSNNQDDTAAWLTSQIKQIFGDIDDPEDECTSYSWDLDPLATGCYSYCEAGDADSREKLASLKFPGLYFAGEANSLDYYGQLDGALETAQEAGGDMIAYLRTLPD